MEYAGLIQWANSARHAMATDPGRQLFKDQVDAHGFRFLDDYLENIVSGAKEDPLIELVKTPGRKKAIGRKPKIVSKLAHVSEEPFEESLSSGSYPKIPQLFAAHLATTTVNKAPAHQAERQSVDATHVDLDSTAVKTIAPPTSSGTLNTAESHGLSVIAEDEELSGDRSLRPSRSSLAVVQLLLPSSVASDTGSQQDIGRSRDTISSSGSYPSLAPDVSEKLPMDVNIANGQGNLKLNGSTSERQKVTNDDSDDHEMEVVNHTLLDDITTKTEKTALPTVPSLPDPAPLRKSMRYPPVQTVMAGGATPGAPAGGKRSSWLIKAREIKALEIPKKVVEPEPNLPPPHLGKKRKSEDGHLAGTTTTERHSKTIKTVESDTASRSSKESAPSGKGALEHTTPDPDELSSDEGALHRLKKTMEGLTSRNFAKSMGGGAATALAEAKKAAEATVASRNGASEGIRGASTEGRGEEAFQEFRLSNLFPREQRVKEKSKSSEKATGQVSEQKPRPAELPQHINTTPLNSPPPPTGNVFAGPGVFKKPGSVFVPPTTFAPSAPSTSRERSLSPQLGGTLPKMTVGLVPRLPVLVSPKYRLPLTAQSTMESVRSDALFDAPRAAPAWMPQTQDTDYTDAFDTQPSTEPQVCDEDDSWPIDEKISAGVQWTFAGKDDSLTWSTAPRDSMTGEGLTRSHSEKSAKTFEHERDVFQAPEEDVDSAAKAAEPEATIASSKTGEAQQVTNDESTPSLNPSNSPSGFFGQATKLFSTGLAGSTKKKQPEVKKALQSAGPVAKKLQEDAEKKMARLKESEARRQQALQRKADEEKAKAQEEERKLKEEAERRKKEREDATDKRLLKPVLVKKDDDKKKKPEVERMSELKKPTMSKPAMKSALKPPSSSSMFHGLSGSSTTGEASKAAQADSKAKASAIVDDEVSQPSTLMKSVMAARAKAQIDAAQRTEPLVPSESIDLPDVRSEYSDSEDEDRKRTFDPPDWAQSPELRTQLEMQASINPDDIFGAVRPIKMEELFKTRQNRFRARTSSANWTGADRLTAQEEREYARRMGFK